MFVLSYSLLEDDAIADLEAKSEPIANVSPSKKTRTIRVLGESAGSGSGSSTPSATTPSPGGSRTNSPRGVKRGRGRPSRGGANGLSKHVLKNGLHNVQVKFFILFKSHYDIQGRRAIFTHLNRLRWVKSLEDSVFALDF